MSKITTCLIDLDGVLANFSLSAAQIHGISLPSGPLNETFLYDKVGSKKKFWQPVNTYDFWREIPLYPWSKKLVETIQQTGIQLYILTKCPLGHESWAGKAEWVRVHFPKLNNHLICMRGDKGIIAQEGYLIIDDKKSNCESFAVKGSSYWWPEITEDCVEEAEKRIEDIRKILTQGA